MTPIGWPSGVAHLKQPLDQYQLNTLLVDPPRAGLDAATLTLASRFDTVLLHQLQLQSLADNLKSLSNTHAVTKLAFFLDFLAPHLESMSSDEAIRMTPLTNDAIEVRLTDTLTGALTATGLPETFNSRILAPRGDYEPRGGLGRAPRTTTELVQRMEQFRFACQLTMPRAYRSGLEISSRYDQYLATSEYTNLPYPFRVKYEESVMQIFFLRCAWSATSRCWRAPPT